RAGEPDEAMRSKLETRVRTCVPEADRQGVTEFLGELAGIPFPDEHRPQLRAARADASLMADRLLRAWIDWLAAESRTRPLLLLIDDLHWADAASVRFLTETLT